MRQRIKNEILEEYYEMWVKGSKATQIRKKLKLSQKDFEKYTPDFLAYCRHQVKFDTRIQLTENNKPLDITLTPERENEFLGYVSSGLNYSEAALLMDIPLPTVLDSWFKDAGFKAKVDNAVKLVDARAIQAFYKRVTGYEFDGEIENITYTNETNEKGQVTEKTTSRNVTRKRTHISPDVQAGKFWLVNRMPDNFTMDPKSKPETPIGDQEKIQTIEIGGRKIEF